jgi:sortase A
MRPARGVARREFLTRFLGNTMLAAGGSLVGAAAAYQIYATRAVAGLSELKRGSFVGPDGQAARVAAPPPTVGETPASAQAPAASQPAGVERTAGAEPPVFAAQTPAVAAANTPPGLFPVRLRIQSIGLQDAKIVEVGTKIEKGELVWETADHAVGHHIGTALPGPSGNVVLSGHISSPLRGEGNIFHSLPNLKDKIGSIASIQTADGTWYRYEIVGTNVVTPSDTWVLNPTPTPMLTLLTCVPDGVYTYRFVAQAKYAGHT